jgi:hypothetical protein
MMKTCSDNISTNYSLAFPSLIFCEAYCIETREMCGSGNDDVGCCLLSLQRLPEEASCFHGYGIFVLKVETEVPVLLRGRQPPHVRLQTKHSYQYLSTVL